MKYMILKASPIIFVEMCKKGEIHAKVVSNALPDDTKYIRMFIDYGSGAPQINLVLESNSFNEIKDEKVIPVLPNPMFEKIDK